MKITVLLLALVLAANAQSAGDKPAERRVFTLGIDNVDPIHHAEVMQLLELSGVREKLELQKKSMVEEGRKKLMEKCQKCAPEFGEECARRVFARMRIEDFMNVYARAYEKYLTREDIAELISMQKKTNAHEKVEVTLRLREKLQSVLPSLMGDVMGGCVKLGVEIGGRASDEVAREHPEYIRTASR
jgi:hypothetical protein